MELKNKYTVEISGISKNFPSFSCTFKQFSLQYYSYLESSKPNISHIVRVSNSIKIDNSSLIKTSHGISQEGQVMTGVKVSIHGEVIQNIEYISDYNNRSINSTQLTFPFHTFIVLDHEPFSVSELKIDPYIEDVFIEKICDRKIYSSFLILLNISCL